MKKYLLIFTFLIITIYSNNIVFWDCSDKCQIKNETPQILNDYIKNFRTVITNVTANVKTATPNSWVSKDYNYVKSRVLATFNKMIDWNGYYSYFNFYVTYSIKNEYVYEVWRDYNILDKETKWINNYLKSLLKRWYSGVSLTKAQACAWVPEVYKCEFSWELIDLLWQINKNHEVVKDYYRLSIIWDKWDFDTDIQLVEDNFKNEFNKFYNEFTTEYCSECEWWFSDRLKKSIDKITNWQELSKKWIQDWQEAISILNWSKDKASREKLERSLLQQELSRQWVSTKWSEAILNNLKRFNETGGFSLENNFITNSFNYLAKSIESQIKAFDDSITQSFKRNEQEVPIANFKWLNDELSTTKNIEERIAEIYNKELPYANLQDNTTSSLQWKIIQMHQSLNRAIKTLDETIKIAQDTCNSQAQWLWKCE